MSISNQVIRLPAVLEKVSLSRSTVYQKVKDGTFPKFVKLGERASGWLLHEVDDWVAAQAAARGITDKGADAGGQA